MAITATQNGVRDHGIQTVLVLILNFLERSAGCFFITNKYFNVVTRFFLSVKNDDKNKDRLDKFAMETVSRMFVINE